MSDASAAGIDIIADIREQMNMRTVKKGIPCGMSQLKDADLYAESVWMRQNASENRQTKKQALAARIS